MDLIMTGISASERQRRENLVAATRNLIMEKMQLGGPSMRMIEVKKPLLFLHLSLFSSLHTSAVS
jgi:DNA replication licensing factor MCM4